MPSRRWCWWREILCILFWIIIASAVPVTIVLTVKHRSHDMMYLGYGGDTIELLKVNGFWYDYLTVMQVVEADDHEHRIQLYLPPCSHIKVREKLGRYVSRYHHHSYPTRRMGTIDYLYLLPGSKVTYNICMKSNETYDQPQAKFFIFNEQRKYQDYINGVKNGKKVSVSEYKLSVGRSLRYACSEFTFTAEKSSYYFMAGSCNAGITYQYNVTSLKRYLDFKDYRGNKSCSALTEKHACEILVGTAFLSKSEKYCLLAHVIPHRHKNKHAHLSRTTHIRVNSGKRGEVVVIPTLVIVVGVMGLLVIVVTYFCCCCKKCFNQRPRGREYTIINA